MPGTGTRTARQAAKGYSDNEKLSDVLHKLDEPSLSHLISAQQISSHLAVNSPDDQA